MVDRGHDPQQHLVHALQLFQQHLIHAFQFSQQNLLHGLVSGLNDGHNDNLRCSRRHLHSDRAGNHHPARFDRPDRRNPA
jgi:hypothetical protein